MRRRGGGRGGRGEEEGRGGEKGGEGREGDRTGGEEVWYLFSFKETSESGLTTLISQGSVG